MRNDPALTVTVKGTTTNTDVAAIDSVVIAVMDDELVATAPRNLMAVPGDQSATVTWTGPRSIEACRLRATIGSSPLLARLR